MADFLLNTYNEFPLTDRIINMVREAKFYIKTGNFMFREPKMKEELLDACRRGVVVFILSNLGEDEERLMGVNSFGKKEYDPHLPNLNEFAEHGAHVRCMNELHAKFLVVDGKQGMIMSSNYTKDSLWGNPECGVALDLDDTKYLESIFDTLFEHADDKIEGRDKSGYKFRKVYSPIVQPELFYDVLMGNIRLTLSAKAHEGEAPSLSNFSFCKINDLYESIVDAINDSKEYLYLVTYSFRSLDKLQKILVALKKAAKRGVSINLFYNLDNKGSKATLEKLHEMIPMINAQGVLKNHAKFLLTDKVGLMFTANIDGEAGLLSGFELGVELIDMQWQEARDALKLLIEENKKKINNGDNDF